MNTRLRIAVVVRELPIPIYAGLNLIIHNVVLRLAKKHDTLALVLDKAQLEKNEGYFTPFCCFDTEMCQQISEKNVQEVYRVPRIARYYRVTPDKLAWLQHAVDDYHPDVVIGFGYDLAPYFGLLPVNIPKILDVVDSEILYHWRQIRRGDLSLGQLKHLFASIAAARLYLSDCNAIVTVSNEDTENIRCFAKNRSVYTISNGVDCDYFRPDETAIKIPGRIIFTGSLNWPPNQAAVSWFLQYCWERILARYPDSNLTIIGKLLNEELKNNWEQHQNVQVIGFVPDIRPYVQSALVSIAPMVSGSGIKNKILEAWAMGQPVVATPLAARGLNCNHEVDVLVAGTAQDFAEEILRLLMDEKLRTSIGNNGRTNVLANYSWNGVTDRFEEVLSHHLKNVF